MNRENKNLFVFGDSWPAGAELSNYDRTLTFPCNIANSLGMKLINCSVEATSQDQAVLSFLSRLNDDAELFKNSKVLFCFTGYSRSMKFDQDNSAWAEVCPYNKEDKQYYKKMYTDELGQYNFLKNIILIQHVCKSLDIQIYCVTNWESAPKHMLIDDVLIYDKSLFEIVELTNANETSSSFWDQLQKKNKNRNRYFQGMECHPNVLGHKKISDELTQWIKQEYAR